eukprot:TRINITY_DN6522_c0_g1_i1.p1 TRINITY_DN6522_c0_g1~~TRINITY_DN6522_c0_g1_i1.p1  ORF type:complete len:862 (+),score=245.74 TRINITY_DN6522_c0_g1_i1:22-2607(+)
MCVRVAFDTSKGQLIRSILYPKDTKFRFYQDGLRFLMILSLFGLCGLVYTVVVLLQRSADPIIIVKRALDLITVIVPPALPAAMTIGTIYAINRLKAAKVFCISPPRVNVAGKLKLFCFDKTGTLTEDGLTLWGVLACNPDHTFTDLHRTQPEPTSNSVLDHESTCPTKLSLRTALACCHSLSLDRKYAAFDTPFDTKQRFVGDPLEIELVRASGWWLHEPTSGVSALRKGLQDMLTSLPAELTSLPIMLRPLSNSESGSECETSFNTTDSKGLAVVKEYAFSSQQQRMTVLVTPIGDQTTGSTDTPTALAFVKGAPERVASLCMPDTLPADFHARLDKLTNEGLRVLAVAGRTIVSDSWQSVRQWRRDQVEQDLRFLGLVIFENRVKPETEPVLRQLQDANIRTLMITGDNIKTACSVAASSGMVPKAARFLHARMQSGKHDELTLQLEPDRDEPLQLDSTTYPDGLTRVSFPALKNDLPTHVWRPSCTSTVALAITGAEFARLRRHDFANYQRFIVSASVFARMGPDQKAQLIEDLIDLDYCVGMCGDGANDCGALKAAHVGISLSEAEASVAAPFTSSVPNISCVVTLIREGRAALVTSFSCFKFMALYSFIEFTTVLILYWINANLGDFQYLWIDLVLTLSLALFMAHSNASSTLHHQRPPGSLVAPVILVSIVGQIALHVVAQVMMLQLTQAQSWFVPLDPDPDANNIYCFENTGVFLFSNFQYVAVAVAFTLGEPYRAPVYTNVWFVLCVIGLTALNIVFVLTPNEFIRKTLQLMELPGYRFQLILVGYALGVGVLSYALERAAGASLAFRHFVKGVFRKRQYKNGYKRIARDVLSNNWLSTVRHVRDDAPRDDE